MEYVDNSQVHLHLMKSLNFHLKAAHTNKSTLAYQAIFKIFMFFSIFLNLCLPPAKDDHIVLFVQFLVCNHLSHTSVLNFVFALLFKFQWYGLSIQHLNIFKQSLLLKSIKNATTMFLVSIQIHVFLAFLAFLGLVKFYLHIEEILIPLNICVG